MNLLLSAYFLTFGRYAVIFLSKLIQTTDGLLCSLGELLTESSDKYSHTVYTPVIIVFSQTTRAGFFAKFTHDKLCTIPNFPALVDIFTIKWYNKLLKYDCLDVSYISHQEPDSGK